ncbi:MAG: LysR family transcriptional regulator [Gammaproteobacteria bacterium]|nr:MAG: LysR family transcriptional regulator [Gammaproteobacteria bacterium]
MNIRDIDLNLLAVFEAIYIEENISRAADKLGISQPAMSNALKRLRDTLGDPLFVRTSGSMLPTPRAEELSQPIRSALQLIQGSLESQPDFDYRSANQTFGIAMSDYSEAIILPLILQWLEKSAPNIKIKIYPIEGGNLSKALTNGKIDLAIGRIPFLEEGFRAQRLFEEAFVCLVRNSHPEIKDKITRAHFEKFPFISITPRHSAKTYVEKCMNNEGINCRNIIQTPNTLSMPYMVAESNYIAICPVRIARMYADTLELNMLELPFECTSTTINQFWHERFHKHASHQWLRKTVYDLCQRI